jgi:hypothetical protein
MKPKGINGVDVNILNLARGTGAKKKHKIPNKKKTNKNSPGS